MFNFIFGVLIIDSGIIKHIFDYSSVKIDFIFKINYNYMKLKFVVLSLNVIFTFNSFLENIFK